MAGRSFWPNCQNWRRYWPGCVVALLATLQLFVSFAIVGLQIGIVTLGVLSDCYGATARFIVGFVCWGFFFVGWISLFSVSCCNRSSITCATYTLVQNIISFIFAAVMIDFDRKFIAYPFFDANFGLGSSNCNILGAGFDLIDVSTQLHKGQLAGAVIMLVSSLIYVSIYGYTYIRAISSGSPPSNMPFPNHGPFVPNQMIHANEPIIQLQPSSFGGGLNNDPHLAQRLAQPSSVICPNCGTAVATYESF